MRVPCVDWPVASMPPILAAAIDSDRVAVRISSWTAAKQLYHHPDLAPTDYALLQRILDEGRVYHAARSIVAYLKVDGRSWLVVVKAKSKELYLSTFHRSGIYYNRSETVPQCGCTGRTRHVRRSPDQWIAILVPAVLEEDLFEAA